MDCDAAGRSGRLLFAFLHFASSTSQAAASRLECYVLSPAWVPADGRLLLAAKLCSCGWRFTWAVLLMAWWRTPTLPILDPRHYLVGCVHCHDTFVLMGSSLDVHQH